MEAGYRPNESHENDLPSMVESETSSVENKSLEDDQWNGKGRAPPLRSSSYGYYDDYAAEDAYAKKPAALGSRLPVTQVAFTNAPAKTMIEVSPGLHLRLRGADET